MKEDIRIGGLVRLVGDTWQEGWRGTEDRVRDLDKAAIIEGSDNYEPVDLYPDLLARMGFSFDGVKHSLSLGFFFLFSHDGFTVRMAGGDRPYKHAHEIQALYFYITGEELQIKEK